VSGRVKISIEVSQETADLLVVLATSSAVDPVDKQERVALAAVVGHLVASAADGVRRPGAWERGWVEQAFGTWKDAF
jgi:hypothetical protein